MVGIVIGSLTGMKSRWELNLSQCLLLIFCVLSFCDIIFVTNIFNFYCLHTVAWYACNAVSANTSTGYFQRNVPSAFYVSFLLHQIGVGAICLLDGHSVCLSVCLAGWLSVYEQNNSWAQKPKSTKHGRSDWFGSDPFPSTDSWSLFRFRHHCGVGDSTQAPTTACVAMYTGFALPQHAVLASRGVGVYRSVQH